MSNSKKLKFVHITKCAGTTIEDIGLQHGFLWGRFDPEYASALKHNRRLGSLFANTKSLWHYPPMYFAMDDLQQILHTHDFFAIVKNPYERIISEYYCKWNKFVNPNQGDINVHVFNQNLNIILRKVKEKWMLKKRFNLPIGDHFAPQYIYLTYIQPENIIPIERVNELFERYNVDICITPHDKHNVSNKQFSVSDINRTNLDLINELYAEDFAALNICLR